MPESRERPYHIYIRTEEFFYDELVVLEAERIALDALSIVRADEGFTYLEHTGMPVVPRTRDSFTPAGTYDVQQRLEIAHQRSMREIELIDFVGRENVWLGPQISQTPEYPGLSESEQRGFWTRET
jgi:hypothetical protein